MKKVSVIGHYAYGLNYLDGQTIKTKIITNELCKEYGETNTLQFDTHGGAKTLLKGFDLDIKGVSAVVTQTGLGQRLFEAVKDKFYCQPMNFDEIIAAQSYGKLHSVKTDDRLQTLSLLSSNLSMTNIIKKHRKLLPAKIKVKNLLKNGLKHLPTGIYNTLKSVIHKTGD